MSQFDFIPFSTQYEPKNALLLSRLANLAYYSNEDKIKSDLSSWGLPTYHLLDAEGTQGIIATNDETVIVAFRGTEFDQIEDVITDADVRLVPGPKGLVHSGFKQAVDVVWDEMLAKIDEYQGKTVDGTRVTTQAKSLWFTGHSLGAALATLAVARLRLEMDRGVFGLYTFGSPRTGNPEFSSALNTDFKPYIFRFVNNNDVVTRVPLRKMDYSHVGSLTYIDADGSFYNDIGWWWRFLDRVQGRVEDFLEAGTDGAKDHGSGNYIDAITRQLNWRPRR
ncbi:MAG: lipase family protein [Chloroflexota bacterium]